MADKPEEMTLEELRKKSADILKDMEEKADGLEHPYKLTREEVEFLDTYQQAEARASLADNLEAALGAFEESTEAAARVVSHRGETILDLFANMSPADIDTQLSTDASAAPAAFTLGVTKLGALDMAGKWYRKAAAAFSEGNYPEALGSFIDADTAAEIKTGINKDRKQFAKKYNREMTLADFLSRYPYKWEGGDTLEDLAKINAALEGGGALPPKESFFDLLLQKLEKGFPINGRVPGDVHRLMDKPSRQLPDLIPDGKTEDFQVRSQKDLQAGKDPLYIHVSVNFEALKKAHPELVNQLDNITEYDMDVYNAICSIWLNWSAEGRPGNVYLEFTGAQVYAAMGHTSRPPARELEKIHTSIIKFTAPFHLDNKEEAAIYKSKTYKNYDGNLMNISAESDRFFANGQIAKTSYKVTSIPALLDFAMDRGQIMKLPLAALEAPGDRKQTEQYRKIRNYIFYAIYRARNEGKKKFKDPKYKKREKLEIDWEISLKDFYEKIGLKTYTTQGRGRDDLNDLLYKFKNLGLLTRYRPAAPPEGSKGKAALNPVIYVEVFNEN